MVSDEKSFTQRIWDSFLPRSWQTLDEFARHCDSEGVSEVEVAVETRFEGSGPDAAVKYRPVYTAADGQTEYTGRWNDRNWTAEFADYPDFEDIRASAYDSWERFILDREYMESEYGLDTTAEPDV